MSDTFSKESDIETPEIDTPDMQLSDDDIRFREYLDSISSTPLLSFSQERELAQKYDDPPSRERLFQSGLHLVVSHARKVFVELDLDSPPSLMDLIEGGNIGLIESMNSFDPDFSTPFRSYAYWQIRSGINRVIRSHGRDLKFVHSGEYSYVDDEDHISDLIDLSQLFGCLEPVELTIVQKLLDDRTLDDVGKELNLTRERIRQINENALEKMGKFVKSGRPVVRFPSTDKIDVKEKTEIANSLRGQLISIGQKLRIAKKRLASLQSKDVSEVSSRYDMVLTHFLGQMDGIDYLNSGGEVLIVNGKRQNKKALALIKPDVSDTPDHLPSFTRVDLRKNKSLFNQPFVLISTGKEGVVIGYSEPIPSGEIPSGGTQPNEKITRLLFCIASLEREMGHRTEDLRKLKARRTEDSGD